MMSKYDALGDFLRKQRTNLVPLTFREIERLTGTTLPPSSTYRAWWSNNPFNSVMTKIWLDAGFRSEQVDMERRKLVFRRVGQTPSSTVSYPGGNNEQEKPFHPLFGALKNLTSIPPGVDLTQPADPDWGKAYD
jgi:hypothetical protein